MGYVDQGTRRFSTEFASLLDKHVVVRTTDDRIYRGRLVGYNSQDHSLVLADVEVGEGESYPLAVIYGHVIAEILLTEQPLDMEELARRLEEVFPKMVKYYPEARLITVMDRVKVTERGVEGSGPLAQRVKDVFDRFLEEWRRRKE